VVAKSAFNSSMNYESVMIFGKAKLLKDDEKMAAMTAITEVLVPGMSSYARELKPKEVAGTMIVEVPLTKYSAKSRTGGVIDEPEDKELPIWSGIIPLTTLRGTPITADDSAGIAVPPHIK
jgi:nitroimidazol reductase NimA-like FMN-containing flavoprotein (pyridoxamine 5'-phosphate oxidase superfamily)